MLQYPQIKHLNISLIFLSSHLSCFTPSVFRVIRSPQIYIQYNCKYKATYDTPLKVNVAGPFIKLKYVTLCVCVCAQDVYNYILHQLTHYLSSLLLNYCAWNPLSVLQCGCLLADCFRCWATRWSCISTSARTQFTMCATRTTATRPPRQIRSDRSHWTGSRWVHGQNNTG